MLEAQRATKPYRGCNDADAGTAAEETARAPHDVDEGRQAGDEGECGAWRGVAWREIGTQARRCVPAPLWTDGTGATPSSPHPPRRVALLSSALSPPPAHRGSSPSVGTARCTTVLYCTLCNWRCLERVSGPLAGASTIGGRGRSTETHIFTRCRAATTTAARHRPRSSAQHSHLVPRPGDAPARHHDDGSGSRTPGGGETRASASSGGV